MREKCILIGLGNPIMSDDRIGIIVAEKVGKRLPHLEVDTSCYGSLDVVDRICGFGKAIILDSMMTQTLSPGTVRRVKLDENVAIHCSGSHGVGLSEAIEIARACGSQLPSRILIYGIEVRDPFTVGNSLSEELSRNLESIVDIIVRDLEGEV